MDDLVEHYGGYHTYGSRPRHTLRDDERGVYNLFLREDDQR
jgi:hypothetical protein